ncbi:MAG: RNA polymerase factor sigma-54 [Synergistaceae bacterium]|jgi:RNA polymerase sigma-54 factor|nr:RNA polymerase factor sigma-54 [Synergistaceae bacterium]
MEQVLSLDHKQVLSSRMQLSAQILQMDALDLSQFIQECALENPLIELDAPVTTEDAFLTRLNKLEWLDAVDESSFCQYAEDAEEDEYDRLLSGRQRLNSLSGELLAQLPGFKLPEEVEKRVRYIIAGLDDNGYLSASKKQLSSEMECNMKQLEEALRVLHCMTPLGVGAENLRECLLIQARGLEERDPVLIALIDRYLDLLGRNQLAKIAQALRVSVDDVKKARRILLALNPKPGNGFSSDEPVPYIHPDLFILQSENHFQAVLNNFSQPRIRISRYYRDLAKAAGSEIAAYVNDRLNKADWLISCIQKRENTILKSAECILRRQTDFFKRGPGNLIPMTLADIADDLGMHPSTISRAVGGKYLKCRWGIFGLPDLFSHTAGANSQDRSHDMVLSRIRRILARENPAHPFSDQEIADKLRQKDVRIARRTVTKYREQLKIPPAGRRKQY